MKKIFGDLNITWKRLIILAILIGIYTGIVAQIPFLRDTSFADISISFEVWVLFGIVIIMNSKSAKESALKCFIFFLISQPIVYLVQVWNNPLGWGIFRYYPPWFRWTLLTIPMGFVGYYLKKNKWWGLFILTPVIAFVGYHYLGFLREAYSFFPNHLLSALFCLATMIIYPLYIYKDKKIKIIGLIISILLIIVTTFFALSVKRDFYNTTVLISNTELAGNFDDTYKVSLKDPEYGEVYIVYEKNIEDYMVNAKFAKTGNTELILESPDGTKVVYSLKIERSSYDIKKK